MTSSSITLEWEPLNCIDENGIITGYSVQYGVLGSGIVNGTSVAGDNVTGTTLSDLVSSTNYLIEVAAMNAAGVGPYEAPLSQFTEGMFTIALTKHISQE